MTANEPAAEKQAARVYVIEDDADERASLVFALDAAGHHPAAFETAEAFLAAVDPVHAEGCVITDLRLPGMSGLQLVQEMMRRGTRLRMIVVTAFGRVSTAVDAMHAGALDFLEKPFQPGEILGAVTRALSAPPPPFMLRAEGIAAAAQLAKLSPRERQVFDLLVAGRLGKEIGRELGLSPRTVEVHRANAMRRLDVHTLPEMVRLALLAKLGGGGVQNPE